MDLVQNKIFSYANSEKSINLQHTRIKLYIVWCWNFLTSVDYTRSHSNNETRSAAGAPSSSLMQKASQREPSSEKTSTGANKS